MIKITSINNGELVIFDVTGRCDFNEIKTAILENYHLADKYVLWDFGNTDVSALTNDEIYMVAGVVKEHANHEKTAYVGNSDLEYGLLNMYKAFAEISEVGPRPMVFKTTKEAREWLYSFGETG